MWKKLAWPAWPHHFTSLRGEEWAHKIIWAFLIEVPVPSQESEWWCICVLGISILSLFLRFFHWKLGLLFWQCGMFCFSFYYFILCQFLFCLVFFIVKLIDHKRKYTLVHFNTWHFEKHQILPLFLQSFDWILELFRQL